MLGTPFSQPLKEGIIRPLTPTVTVPRGLKSGDTIGIVAPASPFDPQKLDQGRAILERMGFRTCLAPGLFERQGHLAGSDRHRAEQVMAMLTDSTVDAVMCARGGYGSLRMLPFMNWEVLQGVNKPVIGFSDISALLQAIYLHTGLVVFHGPMVCSLVESDMETQVALKQALISDQSDQAWSLSAEPKTILRAGRAQGILVGGNLTTLCHLVGTPYGATYDGSIFFIEDVGEAPYRIDRSLQQMMQAGHFRGIRAIALGSFEKCGDAKEIQAIVGDLFRPLDIPILAGFSMGHGNRNLTWPLGVACCLDTGNGRISRLESATARPELSQGIGRG